MKITIDKNGSLFAQLLAILFIGLKLCHVIDWSWVWVLSPLWVGAAIVILIMCTVGLFQWLSYRRWN